MGAPADEPAEDKPAKVLDAEDIRFLKTYGLGPYAAAINSTESDIKDVQKRVVETIGIKESDTGLAPPSRWDIVADKQMLYEEQPLQVKSFLVLLRLSPLTEHVRQSHRASQGSSNSFLAARLSLKAAACFLLLCHVSASMSELLSICTSPVFGMSPAASQLHRLCMYRTVERCREYGICWQGVSCTLM